ncbi:MAG: protoheme IX farnesyltransferase [Ignavibacteriae bacterium]|nr:protoheme IX farnesyltransferase [Ignavibacteriota bacterium]NOG99148.1 protoheme IX farnesyltransferase [Ignavibacteriota bacterium]
MAVYQDKIEPKIELEFSSLTAALRKYLSIVAELGKFRITFFVAFSTSVGFILFNSTLNFDLLFISLGVFLLASGSSAINHIQERNLDKLMNRTINRPLPSGKIGLRSAIILSMLFLVFGFALLGIYANLVSVLLGFIAIIWYNIIYTPLKRKSALAVVPGSVIGAIPPMIGWTAAGGYVFDTQILTLALFFFIWQIPHFWLLLLLYNKDYQKAGYPTLSKLFSEIQIRRVTFIWIAALSTTCMLIPVFDLSSSLIITTILLLLGFWLVFKTRYLLKPSSQRIQFRRAFGNINIYVLLVVLLLIIDRLVITEF